MDVSVREFKSHLSEYLRRAAVGEEIIVMSRGKPIARLTGVAAPLPEEDPEAAAIARFRSLPWVRPGSGKKPSLPEPLIRIEPGEKTLAEIVSEQRG